MLNSVISWSLEPKLPFLPYFWPILPNLQAADQVQPLWHLHHNLWAASLQLLGLLTWCKPSNAYLDSWNLPGRQRCSQSSAFVCRKPHLLHLVQEILVRPHHSIFGSTLPIGLYSWQTHPWISARALLSQEAPLQRGQQPHWSSLSRLCSVMRALQSGPNSIVYVSFIRSPTRSLDILHFV